MEIAEVAEVVAVVLQMGLGLVFVFHASLLLAADEAQLRRRGVRWVVEIPPALRVFAGTAEGLAGLALIVPWASGVLPWLTPLAAAGLVLLMVGAIVVHVRRREYAYIVLNLVLLALVAAIAYARWPALAGVGIG